MATTELRDLRPASRGYSVRAVAEALNAILADSFALYLKTKNFHWHVSGPHFRDYHLLLDEQAAQILAVTDAIAERVRKTGGTTLRSVGHIARLQRIDDNDAEQVGATEMLAELHRDNLTLVEASARSEGTGRSRRRQCHFGGCSTSGPTRPRNAPGFCSRRPGAADPDPAWLAVRSAAASPATCSSDRPGRRRAGRRRRPSLPLAAVHSDAVTGHRNATPSHSPAPAARRRPSPPPRGPPDRARE